MRIFVDTSAFLAILDATDENHSTAQRIWQELLLNREMLICSNYVLVETLALIQRHFGMPTVRIFQDRVTPVLQIEWADEALQQAAVTALFAANQPHLSLVDCMSFQVCRRLGVDAVFAFDEHFVEQGFTCLF